MNHLTPLGLGLLLFFGCVVISFQAQAQVGSALIAVPWQPGQSLSSTNYFLGLQADSEGTGFDTDLTRGVSYGRARFDADDPRNASVGWLYDHTELDGNDPALPERLVTAAVAGGVGLAQLDSGWDLSLSLGGGFAGDLPFTDEDAWFAVGSLVAHKEIDPRTHLLLILDYDGSRAIWPDIPLPGVQYLVVESESLRYSLGVPFSSFYYEPDDRWSFELQYIIPLGGYANVEFEIDDQWTAFGSYASSTRGYHLDGDDEHRRLFFEQDRLEAGLKFEPGPGWTWTFAGGWAFNQEFTRGFDTRDTDTVRDLDDAPFLRVGLNFSF